MNPAERLRLRIEVRQAPRPGLLRQAIESRLAGRCFGSGPEDEVGRAVAEAILRRSGMEPRR